MISQTIHMDGPGTNVHCARNAALTVSLVPTDAAVHLHLPSPCTFQLCPLSSFSRNDKKSSTCPRPRDLFPHPPLPFAAEGSYFSPGVARLTCRSCYLSQAGVCWSSACSFLPTLGKLRGTPGSSLQCSICGGSATQQRVKSCDPS